MPFLPLALSLAVGALIVPVVVRGLRRQGYLRENYRGTAVAFPAGVAIAATALVALVPLAAIDTLSGGAGVIRPGAEAAVTYVIGVSLLGLLDDLLGDRVAAGSGEEHAPRGWRGHARALARGAPSTGALKALGALGLALLVLSGTGLDGPLERGEYLLATGVLVLATNLFNLLDLRPGRSIKAFVVLGTGLTLGSFDLEPLWTLGLFLGPILALAPIDLREQGMLGDVGSNAIGAVAGLWLVLALSPVGQAIALALIAAATVYGEFRSISTLIERTPLLRHLDSVGRMRHA